MGCGLLGMYFLSCGGVGETWKYLSLIGLPKEQMLVQWAGTHSLVSMSQAQGGRWEKLGEGDSDWSWAWEGKRESNEGGCVQL